MFSISCADNDDNLYQNSNTEVQNFIWKGLNNYYLWQQNVPDLADNLFVNPYLLNDFIATKGSPENTFQELLYFPASKYDRIGKTVDRFSVLVDDYNYLENLFQGIRTTSGIVADYKYKNGVSGPIFGYVQYVLPNSDAAAKNIKRGDIFYAVNGTQLTNENRSTLFANDNYSLDFATYFNGNITPNGVTIALTKTQITENPIYINKTFNIGAKKIAYLMYNSFTSNFNLELNDAFAQIAAANCTDLVLDLRYNRGGSIQTASYLASMITGQFNGQVFAKQQWNPRIEDYFLNNNAEALVNRFTNIINGVGINSLNLSKIYILTSDKTASASELVINGLIPYINVVQVGATTTGKNAGSITLYDSPNFSKTGVNPHHKYAMQPLVLKTSNKAGFGDYEKGLSPTVNNVFVENLNNLGVLGQANEPLLQKALDLISLRVRGPRQIENKTFYDVPNTSDNSDVMYLDKLPAGFEKIYK
ncbi:MAG: peptidase S41 [Flavobacterium sp.]|nr:peptidase S41 [Flavobacterium sp.]